MKQAGAKKEQIFVCVCGDEFCTPLNYLRHLKHKRCPAYRKEIAKQEHIEKYGCDHPSKRKNLIAQRQTTRARTMEKRQEQKNGTKTHS